VLVTPSSETVSYGATKIGALRRRGVANWMAGAVKPSHKGLFRAKAKRAGMSTAAYAAKEAHSPNPTLRREAVLARTFAKFRPKKPGLHAQMHRLIRGGAFKKKKAAA
jgi:hypothetical protein